MPGRTAWLDTGCGSAGDTAFVLSGTPRRDGGSGQPAHVAGSGSAAETGPPRVLVRLRTPCAVFTWSLGLRPRSSVTAQRPHVDLNFQTGVFLLFL